MKFYFKNADILTLYAVDTDVVNRAQFSGEWYNLPRQLTEKHACAKHIARYFWRLYKKTQTDLHTEAVKSVFVLVIYGMD